MSAVTIEYFTYRDHLPQGESTVSVEKLHEPPIAPPIPQLLGGKTESRAGQRTMGESGPGTSVSDERGRRTLLYPGPAADPQEPDGSSGGSPSWLSRLHHLMRWTLPLLLKSTSWQ